MDSASHQTTAIGAGASMPYNTQAHLWLALCFIARVTLFPVFLGSLHKGFLGHLKVCMHMSTTAQMKVHQQLVSHKSDFGCPTFPPGGRLTFSLFFIALVSKAPLLDAVTPVVVAFAFCMLWSLFPPAPFAFPTCCKSDEDADVVLSESASSSSPLLLI